MKKETFGSLTKFLLIAICCCMAAGAKAQDDADFWGRVRFGGSLGVAFGNRYTDVTIAPGAIYQFNEYVAAGVGVQGTYVRQKDFYESYIYGGSVIGLFNPIPEIQLSVEVEQLRVNLEYDEDYLEYWDYAGSPERDFWNTALFLGAGYSTNNVTVGLRYNVLFNEDDLVYSDALMPFIRVYF